MKDMDRKGGNGQQSSLQTRRQEQNRYHNVLYGIRCSAGVNAGSIQINILLKCHTAYWYIVLVLRQCVGV